MEGYRCLFISTVCTFPIFEGRTPISSWAPIEIPVLKLSDNGSRIVEGVYGGGEGYEFKLSAGEHHYHLPGASFRLMNANHTLFFVFPQATMNPVNMLPITVKPHGRTHVVYINPIGCYAPISSEVISGGSFHTLAAFYVVEGRVVKHPVIGSDVYQETDEPWYRLP